MNKSIRCKNYTLGMYDTLAPFLTQFDVETILTILFLFCKCNHLYR